MRMIGTISSAIGFIFLGIWMIVGKSNPQLADAMFKWWPMIIIVLGVEVLTSISARKPDSPKPRFNGLVIFVIVIFLFVNGFKGVFDTISPFRWNLAFDNIITHSASIDNGNYKEIKVSKTLAAPAKSLRLDAEVAILDIHKSSSNTVKIEGSVYVDQDADVKSYDIKAKKNAGTGGYEVAFDEGYIKKIRVDLYIPDGCDLKLKNESSKITGQEKLGDSNFEIDTDSGTVDLKGGKSLNLRIGSGRVDISDIASVKLDSDSGTVNLDGDVQSVSARLSSGMFRLDNEKIKNVDVEMDSGTVDIKTNEKNINVDAKLDSGICTVNGDRRVNSGVSKTFGTGQNKVKVSMGSGILKISSRE